MKERTLQRKMWLREHIPYLLAVLIIVQPVLDVLSFWQSAIDVENVLTLVLRFLILAVIAAIGFYLSEHKKFYLGLALVLAVYAVFHVAAIVQVDLMTLPEEGEVVGVSALFSDLANLVRVVQIPIFTLCLITFLKQSGERGYEAVQKSLLAVLMLIAGVEVVSVLTDTNPYTYANKSLGILGWFATTSAQSAVLSMLVPVVLMGAIQKESKTIWKPAAICALGLGMLFFFGTRLTFIALLATAVGLSFTILVAERSKKRFVAVLLICTAICAAAFPWSPMYQNQMRVSHNAELKQEHIDSLVASGEVWAVAEGLEGKEYDLRCISGAYDHYLGGLVDKYGLERVAEAYDYSTDVSVIASARLEKRTFCSMMMEDAPLMAHLFGLELGDMTYLEENYDLENDFHGIYMLYGIVGLALVGIFLLYFVGLILWALLKNAKRYYTLAAGGYGIAFLMAMLHAYATAGVLRRPNASIYLSVVLAVIYFLVMIRESAASDSTDNKKERVL